MGRRPLATTAPQQRFLSVLREDPVSFLAKALEGTQTVNMARKMNERALESEGGVITNSRHQADYLFSNDAGHRDTRRIYNSLEYIENKATVFHASFLRSHIQTKTETMVTLGHFILPPFSLHEEIRREIGKFIWEQDNSSHIQLPRDQEDEPMNPEHKRHTTDCDHSKDIMLLHKYPENNMFSGYTSIDQLRKLSEELHDFTPGASEYCVLYVHGNSSDFPGIKAVHNKI